MQRRHPDEPSRERLTPVLGRERLKDTSLDYGSTRTEAEQEIRDESRDSARAYAERRGLVPVSEIVLRDRQVEPKRAESARPRRSLFAGLKLDASPVEAALSRAASPAPTTEDRAEDRLAQSAGPGASERNRAARSPGGT